ncbi:tetraspanin-33 [Aplysia californica]|uniref:Tetraspanin-33 n=1 Tax=Aplysia californica TaxID=6500 RepID=A0ABM1AG00_APLCA|nr:tetraspanin-33 [Aplysia californica]
MAQQNVYMCELGAVSCLLNTCITSLPFPQVVGLVMTGLGAYILSIKDKQVHDVLDFFLDPACDMCLAGSIVFVMGFLGCTGALREIVCFLKIVSFHHSATHILLLQLGCCGLSDSEKGFLDWNDNAYFNCSSTNMSPERCSVPHSNIGDSINYQCGANMIKYLPDGEIEGNNANTYRIYNDGCMKALGDWINRHALVVGGIMLGILLPQVFIVVLTRNLIEMIETQKSYW